MHPHPPPPVQVPTEVAQEAGTVPIPDAEKVGGWEAVGGGLRQQCLAWRSHAARVRQVKQRK